MTMNRYPSYKPTGVKWLGEIPSHWEVCRVASIGSFTKGGGISRADLKEDGKDAVLYGDIYTKYNIVADIIVNHISIETAEKSVRISCGDILMTGSGETKEDIGKTIVYKGEEAYIGGDVILFRQKGNDSVFLSYLFNSQYAKDYRFRESKGEIVVHIYSSAIKNLFVALPPLDEQSAIAAYLDTATAKIDAAIAQQQKMIDLLNERKQIIINRAVTKGLNPNVKMKDSGVEWIGEVPEGWNIIPLKAIISFINGYAFDSDDFMDEGEVSIIRISNIADGAIDYEEIAFVHQNQSLCPYLTKVGDLLIAMSGATTGKVGFDNIGGAYVNQRVGIIRSDFQKWVYYWLNTSYFKEYIYLSALGSAQPNISSKGIKNFRILFPSKEEYEKIVENLELLCQKVDNALGSCKKQISLLQERKQIIINEVVTGRVRVI